MMATLSAKSVADTIIEASLQSNQSVRVLLPERYSAECCNANACFIARLDQLE